MCQYINTTCIRTNLSSKTINRLVEQRSYCTLYVIRHSSRLLVHVNIRARRENKLGSSLPIVAAHVATR